MTDRGLIGRCGLYCEACIMYGVSHREGEAFEERRRKIAKFFECDVSQVACEGCQQLTETCWGNGCEVLLCLNKRGYRYCDECPDIDSCEKFGGINERYGGLKESMERRREVGDEQWLAEKRVDRTCKQCGGVIYYYDEEVCVKCAYKNHSNE